MRRNRFARCLRGAVGCLQVSTRGGHAGGAGARMSVSSRRDGTRPLHTYRSRIDLTVRLRSDLLRLTAIVRGFNGGPTTHSRGGRYGV